MKKFPPFPCRMNDAVLMVSSYQCGELEGWLAHPRLDGPQKINSVPQMLLKGEAKIFWVFARFTMRKLRPSPFILKTAHFIVSVAVSAVMFSPSRSL